MKFENILTSMFKERENPEVIFEPCIGIVIEAPPNLTINIWDGKVTLYPKQLYMNDRLFNNYTRMFESEGSIESITINATTSNEVCSKGASNPHGTISGKGTVELKGTIVNTDTLTVGDLVKVTPVENGQKWIVDFKIRKLK